MEVTGEARGNARTLEGIAMECLRRVLQTPRPSAEEVSQANAALNLLYLIREE